MKVKKKFLPGSNEVQNADEPETDSNCGVTNDARHTLTVLLIVQTAPSKPLVYTPETLQSKDSHRLDSNGACDVLSLNQKVLVLHTWYQIPEGFVH